MTVINIVVVLYNCILSHQREEKEELLIKDPLMQTLGFPGGSEDKAPACNAGDPGSIPGLGRSPGEGNGNPLQYSCLENPMERGAWRATVHGVAKSRTQLSDFAHHTQCRHLCLCCLYLCFIISLFLCLNLKQVSYSQDIV